MSGHVAGDAVLNMPDFVCRARRHTTNRARRATNGVLQPAAQRASVTKRGMPKVRCFATSFARQHTGLLDGGGGQLLRLFDDHLDDLDDGAEYLSQEDGNRYRVAKRQRQRSRRQMGWAANLLGQQETDKLGRDRRNQRNKQSRDKYRE